MTGSESVLVASTSVVVVADAESVVPGAEVPAEEPVVAGRPVDVGLLGGKNGKNGGKGNPKKEKGRPNGPAELEAPLPFPCCCPCPNPWLGPPNDPGLCGGLNITPPGGAPPAGAPVVPVPPVPPLLPPFPPHFVLAIEAAWEAATTIRTTATTKYFMINSNFFY